MRGDGQSSGTELVLGQTVRGSTDDEASSRNLSCGSPDGAGDETWSFVPPATGGYRFTVRGQYDCSLGIFGPDDAAREMGCNDDAGSNNVSVVAVHLEAGRRYFAVVDGYRANEGDYELVVEAAGDVGSPGPAAVTGPTIPTVVPEEGAAMQPRCASAPILGPGVTNGTLDPTVSTARTSCGSGPGGDVVYRMELQTAAQVTLKLEAVFDGILELRADCSGGRVVACNDDTGDAQHSQVDARLPAGTYWVVVDSYDPRSMGTYSLQLILLP